MKQRRFILYIDKSNAYLDYYNISEEIYNRLFCSFERKRKVEFVVPGLLSDYKVIAYHIFANFIIAKIKRVRKQFKL